ncbi:FecR domain-containing protein [Phenylobacterium sp.]|uniref:FecR family protein n=1 Tax=Phenylobacterium sp. TaxID=1871053 RepID=UPI0025CEAAE3|nr:FecR domain-containing protein [Phenylobacterium sp.]MBX3483025.1 FecR domain-containing protein [Phenylobacterium sp.]MCW5759137.1 FecR domain-containing protein [Phenylobacterium sp.]
MATVDHDQDDGARRLATASAWRVALADGDAETSEDFEAWLSADARNADAWARVQASWAIFGDHATAPEMMAARRDALEHARRRGQRRFAWPRGRLQALAATAVSLALMIALAGAYWFMTKPDVYRTALGERRIVVLADGSRLAMDSATLIEVRWRRDARKLDILRGQARFDVARDQTRPFSVHARDQTVIATGTSFNIDLLGPRVLVTLIEGHVVVVGDQPGGHRLPAGPKPAGTAVHLEPGEQLVAGASGPSRVEKVNLDKSTAWEAGQLVFDNEALSAVAARVSHYTDRPIVVADPVAANLRISGVFKSGDAATFVDTVTRYLPVAASVGEDGAVELRSRN